ncbi:MAG: (d)CMP kinase [Patescibacteria group bacterium]
MQDLTVPVITLDGLAGVGKGATRSAIAKKLGYRELDSGALYRAIAFQAHRMNAIHDIPAIVRLIPDMDVQVDGEEIFIAGKRVTSIVRSTSIGKLTSMLAKVPQIRDGALSMQLSARVAPGLVADGRDMAFIFETEYRFWLEAAIGVRAKRRLEQLRSLKRRRVSYAGLLRSMQERDMADVSREVSPAIRHPKAWIIDTGITKDPEETAAAILLNCQGLTRVARA